MSASVSLKGRNAVVTGSTSGIGLGIAEVLAGEWILERGHEAEGQEDEDPHQRRGDQEDGVLDRPRDVAAAFSSGFARCGHRSASSPPRSPRAGRLDPW